MRMRKAKLQGEVGGLSDKVQADFSDLYRGCSDLKVLVRSTHREGREVGGSPRQNYLYLGAELLSFTKVGLH
jgi:hypothetical protein